MKKCDEFNYSLDSLHLVLIIMTEEVYQINEYNDGLHQWCCAALVHDEQWMTLDVGDGVT